MINADKKEWFCRKSGLAPIPNKSGDGPMEFMLGLNDEDNDVQVEYRFDEESERILTVCPVGGYNVCPSITVDPPPNPEDVTTNPLGTCRCNGELWVSEGCRYGFFCDDSEDIGGILLTCPEVSVQLGL